MCINQCKYLLNPFSDALLHWLYHPLTLLPLSKRVSIRYMAHHPFLQRLVMSSRPLEDHSTLQNYRLERECTIHVTLRLLGGANPPLPRPSTSPVTASELLTWSRRNPSEDQRHSRPGDTPHPLYTTYYKNLSPDLLLSAR